MIAARLARRGKSRRKRKRRQAAALHMGLAVGVAEHDGGNEPRMFARHGMLCPDGRQKQIPQRCPRTARGQVPIASSGQAGWQTLENFAGGKDAFWEQGGDSKDRVVDDLAEAEMQRDAAKDVSVNVAHAPARDEEIDHA